MINEFDEDRVDTIEISVADIKTSRELHMLLKEKLGFPKFYGMNWDAFWDAITGLVEMPRNLIINGWTSIENTMPNDAEIMKKLLNKLNEKYPSWGCKVEYK